MSGSPAPGSVPEASAAPRWLLPGIIAGAAGGVLLGGFGGKPAGEAVGWMGDLFLDALRMIVIPLVMASLVVAVASLGDPRRLGRLGGIAVAYFLVTMLAAVALGLALVTAIEPGAGAGPGTLTADQAERFEAKGGVGLGEAVRGFVHPGLVDAMARNLVLPCIVFAVGLGASLASLGERGLPALRVAAAVDEALLRMASALMWLAPLGILGLVAGRLGASGGGAAAWEEVRRIGAYFGVVVLGLAIHGFLVLPALLRFVGRRPPLPFARGMAPALATALSTASSSATLPVTLRCLEANGVRREVAAFLAPLGATLNMNGTALYEAVAAVFIAQAHGIHLGPAELVIVAVTATLAAIGAAGIPEAGLVTMVLVLQAVGLPLEGMGLILAVDWLLDRFRTTVNVWDDGVGAAVLERLSLRFAPPPPAAPVPSAGGGAP